MNLRYNNIANRQDYMHFGPVSMTHRQSMVRFQYDKMANERNRMQFWELKITKGQDYYGDNILNRELTRYMVFLKYQHYAQTG